jgi:hypothetical protein
VISVLVFGLISRRRIGANYSQVGDGDASGRGA